MTKPVLVAESIAKSFAGRRVLSSATLRAVPGELRVLFGRNGCGKSTLLKIAAGWLVPDGGAIHFDGRVYLSTHLRVLASQGLFYLPDYDLLSTAFTVRHQLEMCRHQFHGGSVDDAAARLGIGDHLERRPSAKGGTRDNLCAPPQMRARR
jgi:ABC-type sugar transport system ATPase subunit